jgi:hypothetical protein
VSSERHCILRGEGLKNCSALKVLRQCPPVLLVKVLFREGKALTNEKDNGLGNELCYEQRKEVEQGLFCLWLAF